MRLNEERHIFFGKFMVQGGKFAAILRQQHMNFFKRILGHIYFFYGMILFVLTMIVVLIPLSFALLFQEPTRAKIVHPIYKTWMSIYLPLVFIIVRRKGKHHFEKGKNYVVVVNHNSLVDIPVSMPWVPGPNKTLAKMEMAKIPLFGIIYKAGSILVDRQSDESRKISMNKMQETLMQGLHLTLYPEGTRNKTSEPLQPFFDGAFSNAILAQKPIIPGIIFGTKEILPNRPKFWARPHVIRFEFLQAVETAGMELKDKNELKQRVHELMKSYIIANR